MQRNVAVTHLADYACDPQGHIQRKGRARDPAAARAGMRAHALFRSYGLRNTLVFAVGAALAAALFFAPSSTLEYGWDLLDGLRRGFVWLMELV